MRRLIASIFCTALILGLSSCKKPLAPEVQKNATIDLKLETAQNINFISDLSSASFEWNRFNNKKIKAIKVYRGLNPKKMKHVATIKSPFATHFLDVGLKPRTQYYYAFNTQTKTHFSKMSELIPVKTQDNIAPIMLIDAISDLPRQVKLIFKPNSDTRVTGYLIERKAPKDKKFKKIARIQGRLNAEYIDTGLLDYTNYQYRVYGYTYDNFYTYPTSVVKARTRKLPPMPKDIIATNAEYRKITVSWKKPKDNLTYNVYSSTDPKSQFRLISEQRLATSITQHIQSDGEVYYYKVTSVDETELESLSDKIIKGSTLAPPKPPKITYAKLTKNKVELRWKGVDKRNVAFIVRTKHKASFFTTNNYATNPSPNTKISFSLASEGDYSYEVIGIDKYGIKSKPSKNVTLKYEIKKK